MADNRALIIGGTGLVGSRLARGLEDRGFGVTATFMSRPIPGLQTLDIRDASQTRNIVTEKRPHVVCLAAAFTNVDESEDREDEAAAVNIQGTRFVAHAAESVGATLVFFSTDYVFDGREGPYREDAEPAPLNVYGRTKLKGEQIVRETLEDHLIVRTTCVYGWDRGSKNLGMQVWQRLGAGEKMLVPSDQVTTPTLADYLAEATLRLVEEGVRGIVNIAGPDLLSRGEFARSLAQAYSLDRNLIIPTPTSELGQRARRPLAGGLDTTQVRDYLGTEPMPLDESLKRLRRQWRSDTYVSAGPTKPRSEAESLKQDILEKARIYHAVAHAPKEFVPFKSRVPYSGRIFGDDEMVNLIDAALDFWLTLGPYGDVFEKNLATFLGSRDTMLVNSGSSANLAAVLSLTSSRLDRPLQPGDEVITPAVTFPTTLAPIVQAGLIPVFVDVELETLNLDVARIDDAFSPRTRAMMVPHTLGNPFDLDIVLEAARAHDLYLIEDSCDALGATFGGKAVGTFGDLGTLSFYPAHQMTMGEGGAVIINKAAYSRILRSIRDWGRDCWCAPGESNTCGKRFGWQLGDLPAGYDHKYSYSHIGFNLKPTDLQAAIGVAQLRRVPEFVERRRHNFERIHSALKAYEDRLILPKSHPRAQPSWFGFPITVREGLSRRSLVQWLEDSNIETRDVFAGNILRQPGYQGIKHRVAGDLRQSDRVMRDTFFIGVYPGISEEMLDFIVERFETYFASLGNAGQGT